jgi:hypothetical protein
MSKFKPLKNIQINRNPKISKFRKLSRKKVLKN